MNQKLLKRILPLFLIALLLFTAAGCGASGGNSGGGSGGGSAASPNGTFKAAIDMTEALSESSGLDIQTELVMYYILTLSSGKDYSMELDTKQFLEDTKAYYKGEMPSLIKQGLINEGYSEDQIEAIVKQKGYSTFDEFANAQLDTVLANLEKQFADSDSVISKGTYKTEGQKISLMDESNGGAVVAEGTIGNDGSLTFELPVNGETTKVVFTK